MNGEKKNRRTICEEFATASDFAFSATFFFPRIKLIKLHIDVCKCAFAYYRVERYLLVFIMQTLNGLKFLKGSCRVFCTITKTKKHSKSDNFEELTTNFKL